MRVLVSGDRDLPAGYGYLHVPTQRVYRFDRPWACDNGAYSGLDVEAFLAMLRKCPPDPRCLFVAMPDVVGDWAKTLTQWQEWAPMIRTRRYPLAIVAQDGATAATVPWADCNAIFIGGTTRWKESIHARTLVSYGRALGKWVHMGRVNGRRRYEYATAIGVQSIDGSAFSRFHDIWTAKAATWGTEGDAVASQRELLWG